MNKYMIFGIVGIVVVSLISLNVFSSSAPDYETPKKIIEVEKFYLYNPGNNFQDVSPKYVENELPLLISLDAHAGEKGLVGWGTTHLSEMHLSGVSINITINSLNYVNNVGGTRIFLALELSGNGTEKQIECDLYSNKIKDYSEWFINSESYNHYNISVGEYTTAYFDVDEIFNDLYGISADSYRLTAIYLVISKNSADSKFNMEVNCGEVAIYE